LLGKGMDIRVRRGEEMGRKSPGCQGLGPGGGEMKVWKGSGYEGWGARDCSGRTWLGKGGRVGKKGRIGHGGKREVISRKGPGY